MLSRFVFLTSHRSTGDTHRVRDILNVQSSTRFKRQRSLRETLRVYPIARERVILYISTNEIISWRISPQTYLLSGFTPKIFNTILGFRRTVIEQRPSSPISKMAGSAVPISLDRFAHAIHDLPASRVYDTVAELQNSQAHLLRSNEEMRDFADLGDQDCREAIEENVEVLERTRCKIELLREEILSRGLAWKDSEGTQPEPDQK